MEITEVRIFLKNEERLKAYASITFDDAFVIRNLKVIQGKKGLFVSMPNRKTKDGEYKDVAHPVNNEMRDMIEKKVLDSYNEKLKEEGVEPAPAPEPVPEPAPEPVPSEKAEEVKEAPKADESEEKKEKTSEEPSDDLPSFDEFDDFKSDDD